MVQQSAEDKPNIGGPSASFMTTVVREHMVRIFAMDRLNWTFFYFHSLNTDEPLRLHSVMWFLEVGDTLGAFPFVLSSGL